MGSILIIDDSSSVRVTLEYILKAAGHQVFLAENGPVGLQVAAENPIDLILLDVEMPILSGLTVLKRLKEDTRLAQIPVVMITATATRDLTERATAAGAVMVMRKPFNIAEFRAEVERRLPSGGCCLLAG